jgi:TRAP-type uncharacterized transport system substrate-binding protein
VSRAPYLVEDNIPGAFYGQTGETPTFGSNAVLVTSVSADAKAVDALSQTMIAHMDDLRTKHPTLTNLTVKKMTTGNTPAPFYSDAKQAK